MLEERKSSKNNNGMKISTNLLNKWCNQDFVFNFKYNNCFMHGDLTPKNIMKNKKNQNVLIDLDRFSINGIKGIDRIHYIIEKESKEKGIDFFAWIQKHFNEWEEREALFLYFVYRINVEHFDKVKLPDIYYNKACNIYNRFIKEFS
jgi:hypothetical protein